jgi:hypothetical protein
LAVLTVVGVTIIVINIPNTSFLCIGVKFMQELLDVAEGTFVAIDRWMKNNPPF